MSRPLVDSKLRVPSGRPRAVPRPRLAARLDPGLHAKLTLVSAPAGFGKTTLLAQWVRTAIARSETPPAVGWLSLDPHDDEPGVFWEYVVATLRSAAGDVGAAALPLLQARGAPPEAGLTLLLNDLGRVPGPLLLVLDDFHVIQAREIHDAVAHLVDRLPPDVHVVLATRVDPPLPLGRLRASGSLVEVRARDLRFRRDEVGEFLAGTMNLSLAPPDVATLADRTEGWAAALQLAGLSLQDRDDPARAIAEFGGDDRFIVDYLAEEVLTRQPDDVREFLLKTSVLQRLTGPLCDAVTGQTGGAARLVELERANLFVVPLDDRRQWYRYHHLFGDVLRAHLAERCPNDVAELHGRASRWLQSAGDLSEAVQHSLAGGDQERAADLMELAFPGMARDRREPELARWVDALPDEVLRRRPVLAVWLAGALAQISSFSSLERRLADVERAVQAREGEWPVEPPAGLVVVDADGYRSMPATVQMYRAALALWRGDPASTIQHAHRALALVPDDNFLVRAGAGALAGLAAWAMGDLTTAHAAYTESTVSMRRAGHLADVLGLAVTLGDLRRNQGRLGDALQTYRDALELVRDAPGAPLRGSADMHVGIAGVLLERGDRAGASAELSTADRLGEHLGLPQNPYRSRVLRAHLYEAEGDLDAALVALDEADRVYNGDYAPNVQPVPAVRARLRLRRGELAQAEEWARSRHLSADDDLSYVREYEHATLARLLLAQHEAGRSPAALGDATRLLGKLAAATEAGGRRCTQIEIEILLARAYAAAGDLPGALDALRGAVQLGEPEGYVRVFADAGPTAPTLLRRLAAEEPGSAYVRQLLTAATSMAVPGPHRPSPDLKAQGELIEPLSERELDVLRLLATDLDGPDIARELHVSLNTMRTHSRNIFRKLRVTSRRAAVRQAAALDLLPKHRDL